MKIFLLICLQIVTIVYGRVLPDYIEDIKCNLEPEEYEKCLQTDFTNIRPYLIKGIPEINLPALDPFVLPHAKIDNQINDLVQMKAEVKNVKVTGFKTSILEGFKMDPKTLTGELKMFFPVNTMEMEYDVNGQLLIIPLHSKGYFAGNFTNSTLHARAKFSLTERHGEKYLHVNKIDVESRIGDGVVKLISKNPSYQFAADLISNFYNQNPRMVMDTINPIYISTAVDLYKALLEPILNKVPAKELLKM